MVQIIPCANLIFLWRLLIAVSHLSTSASASRTRTCDPRFWRPLLYQLSYRLEANRVGVEPTTSGLTAPRSTTELPIQVFQSRWSPRGSFCPSVPKASPALSQALLIVSTQKAASVGSSLHCVEMRPRTVWMFRLFALRLMVHHPALKSSAAHLRRSVSAPRLERPGCGRAPEPRSQTAAASVRVC